MLSAEVVCCKYLPISTEELSIEANSVDLEQTALIGQSLLTVSLSKIHKQNLKNIFFSTKQITFGVSG